VHERAQEDRGRLRAKKLATHKAGRPEDRGSSNAAQAWFAIQNNSWATRFKKSNAKKKLFGQFREKEKRRKALFSSSFHYLFCFVVCVEEGTKFSPFFRVFLESRALSISYFLVGFFCPRQGRLYLCAR